MANREFNQFRLSLEKCVVDLFMNVTFGASGAPTLVVANSKGVRSIVRNSAGDYTVTLQDTYIRLLEVRHVFDTSGISGVAPASPGMWVKAKAVTTLTAPTVRVVFNSAGTATDPATGEIVLMQFTLSNSTAI